MNLNRAALLLSLVALLFFVSTSAGLADISAVQDQLRSLQLKLIGQKISQMEEAILQVGKPKVSSVQAPVEPALSSEEMSRRIQNQISALETLVASLKPRVLDERTAALETRINGINQEIQTATGDRLRQLQNDLQNTLADYNSLNQDVRSALDASLKEQQAAALRAQVRVLQEKILLLPKEVLAPAPQFGVLEDQIKKAQLKLIQAQSAAIQQKIDQLRAP